MFQPDPPLFEVEASSSEPPPVVATVIPATNLTAPPEAFPTLNVRPLKSNVPVYKVQSIERQILELESLDIVPTPELPSKKTSSADVGTPAEPAPPVVADQ